MANRLLVLYVLPNGTGMNRLGLTVGKKVGCAVVRNRVKRWLREQYRLTETDIPTGYDLVFVARGAAGKLAKPEAFTEIGRAMHHLLKKQSLIKQSLMKQSLMTQSLKTQSLKTQQRNHP